MQSTAAVSRYRGEAFLSDASPSLTCHGQGTVAAERQERVEGRTLTRSDTGLRGLIGAVGAGAMAAACAIGTEGARSGAGTGPSTFEPWTCNTQREGPPHFGRRP